MLPQLPFVPHLPLLEQTSKPEIFSEDDSGSFQSTKYAEIGVLLEEAKHLADQVDRELKNRSRQSKVFHNAAA